MIHLTDGGIAYCVVPHLMRVGNSLVVLWTPQRIGYAMGCVKDDDHQITWDHIAMEAAPR